MARLSFDPIEEAEKNWRSNGWDSAATSMSAVTSIMRAQQILLARVEVALRPFDVTFARYETLMLLRFSRQGAMPMSKISERLQVHQSSVTNAVDRLENAALVTRSPHPQDRRATIITLTAAGRDLTEKATEVLNREVFPQLGISSADTLELTRILGALRHSAGDF
ncbi:MAG: MarR family winged helix-turn-helix transcriptional regulator [Nostocoides sp.]